MELNGHKKIYSMQDIRIQKIRTITKWKAVGNFVIVKRLQGD